MNARPWKLELVERCYKVFTFNAVLNPKSEFAFPNLHLRREIDHAVNARLIVQEVQEGAENTNFQNEIYFILSPFRHKIIIR